jgi:hypothetical protein
MLAPIPFPGWKWLLGAGATLSMAAVLHALNGQRP